MDHKNFVGYLSNFEVFTCLKEIKEKSSSGKLERNTRIKKSSTNTHMSTVVYETLQYFQDTPCVVQTQDIIYSFVQKMERFELTKPEKLNILNTRPTKAVDLQAIIEESEERFTEEKMHEILKIIEETLPSLPVEELTDKGDTEINEEQQSA